MVRTSPGRGVAPASPARCPGLCGAARYPGATTLRGSGRTQPPRQSPPARGKAPWRESGKRDGEAAEGSGKAVAERAFSRAGRVRGTDPGVTHRRRAWWRR